MKKLFLSIYTCGLSVLAYMFIATIFIVTPIITFGQSVCEDCPRITMEEGPSWSGDFPPSSPILVGFVLVFKYVLGVILFQIIIISLVGWYVLRKVDDKIKKTEAKIYLKLAAKSLALVPICIFSFWFYSNISISHWAVWGPIRLADVLVAVVFCASFALVVHWSIGAFTSFRKQKILPRK